MPMRLHEVHPSLAHFPLALVPVSIAADIVGAVTGNRFLMRMGAALMPVAAVTGAVTAVAGLVAQNAVEAQGEGHDLLVTHRNLNGALVALTAALAIVRSRTEEPTAGYLAAGVGSALAMN